MNEQQKALREHLDSHVRWRHRIEPGAWREPREYPPKFIRFLQQDNKEQGRILADIEQILETWFIEGVTYSDNSADSEIARVPVHNLPEPVYEKLEKMQLRIAVSILRYMRIPLRLYPEIFMEESAKRLTGKRELKAYFKLVHHNPKGPPIIPMWETREMAPKPRAKEMARLWYENHALRLWHSLKGSLEVSNLAARSTSFGAIEKAMEIEQRLRSIGASDIEIIEYHAYKQGFQDVEVALLSNSLSNDVKSPDKIRENYNTLKMNIWKIPQKS